ncbi:unnamed protein product, partial [Ascophyllum nodosum]
RPNTAPTLYGRSQRGAAPQSRESWKLGEHVSALNNPQIPCVERGNNEMFTACRKDDRDKHLAAWCDGTRLERPDSGDHPLAAQTRSPPSGGARKVAAGALFHPTLYRTDERIEDLGRGGVIRLIVNLGMERYAHRFRAFAVTGADLVTCTEEDLAQIGVSFR